MGAKRAKVDIESLKAVTAEFDSLFYFFQKNGKIVDLGGDANIEEYLSAEVGSALDPNSNFSEKKYLGFYPDVVAAIERGEFANGFHHYVLHGKSEGRESFVSLRKNEYQIAVATVARESKSTPIAPAPAAPNEPKTPIEQPRTERRPMAGRVEKITLIGRGLIARGWAYSPETGGAESVDVSILDGEDEVIYPIHYPISRPDVARAGYGEGLAGFEILHQIRGDVENIKYILSDKGGNVTKSPKPGIVEAQEPYVSLSSIDVGILMLLVDPDDQIHLGSLILNVDGIHEIPLSELVLREVKIGHGEVATKKHYIEHEQIDRHLRARRPLVRLDDTEPHAIYLRRNGVLVARHSYQSGIDCRASVDAISSDSGKLRGWAVEASGHALRQVEILIDDTIYAAVAASKQRDDLERKGIVKRGGGGFEFQMPRVSPDGDVEHFVRIRTCGSQLPANPQKYHFKEASKQRNVAALSSQDCMRAVTVVVPVYNAPDEVAACLESVLNYTSGNVRLIVIDDCSSDPRVGPLLEGYKSVSNVMPLKNDSNIGYTRTINKAISYIHEGDVILLNSDTIVPPNWISRLRRAAYSRHNIATVTPLSTNAGAFSAPEIGLDNVKPHGLRRVEMARAIHHAAIAVYPDVPTGNGFCLYIRGDALKSVGGFDEVAFPRGYGEENDFCIRASKLGLLNIIDDRTYVYHKRSASFGTEKGVNYTAGQTTLHARYPQYKKLTPIFSSDPRLAAARWRARRALTRLGQFDQQASTLPRVAFVVSTQTGGTPQTNRDLMGSLQTVYEPWVLRSDSTKFEVYRFVDGAEKLVEVIPYACPIAAATHDSPEYQDTVSEVLARYDFEIIHIRHLAWHGVSLPKISRELGLVVIYSLHDFYTVCPTVKLLDGEGKYCGGVCSAGEADCSIELWRPDSLPRMRNGYIVEWRRLMATALEYADAFVTTDDTAKDVLSATFEELRGENFHVIPHGRTFDFFDRGFDTPSQSSPLKILVPGNISVAKGLELIRDASAIDYYSIAEFHILGDGPQPWSKRVKHHGKYQRAEFADRARAIRAQVGAVLSIWPETYCHTLTELWASGLPVIAVDIGAVGERIREHGGGWLLPAGSTGGDLLALARRIRADTDDYLEKCKAVTRWQTQVGRIYDNNAMAARYDSLYRSVRAKKLSFHRDGKGECGPEVAVPVVLVLARTRSDRQASLANASTHIRILNRFRNSAERSVVYLEGDAGWFEAAISEFNFDAVLIGRGGLSEEDVGRFISWASERQIPYIVDRDDYLLDVPSDKDPDGEYARRVASEKALLQGAAVIIASTPILQERLRPYARSVLLSQNLQLGRLWSGARQRAGLNSVPSSRRSSQSLRVLYAGTRTHIEDFELVATVLEKLTLEGVVKVYIVGIAAKVPEWCKTIDIPDSAKNYPTFVSWLCEQAKNYDAAIAPLVESEFNRSKSDLKYLDYGMLGIPAIYSEVIPFVDTIRDGTNGLLAQNDSGSWEAALRRLAADEELRRSIAVGAFQDVSRNRIAEDFEAADDGLILAAIDAKA